MRVRLLRSWRKITRGFLDCGTLMWYGQHGVLAEEASLDPVASIELIHQTTESY